MKNAIEFRLLGAGDVAPMRDMLFMFGKAFDDIATYTARQPDDEYLEQMLSSKHFIAIARLVWTQGGRRAHCLCAAQVRAGSFGGLHLRSRGRRGHAATVWPQA